MSTTRRVCSLTILCLALASSATTVAAQTIYRITGPDGKVTFSDKPPASADAKATATTASGRALGAPDNAALPFELRQVAARYPVALYSGANCAPCSSGSRMTAHTSWACSA